MRAWNPQLLTLMAWAFAVSHHSVCGLQVPSNPKSGLNRREALANTATFLSSALVAAPTVAVADDTNAGGGVASANTNDFRAYGIIPDASASLSPDLVALEKSPLLKKLAMMDNKNGGALWLGEHHNSFKDHALQKEIIEAIHKERKNAPLAIGLEQVQIQFQPALDDYVHGRITLEEMKKLVEWETRWFWPFEGYAPIFEAARKLKIPLIALNVNSEDLAEVERSGLQGLPRDRLKQYIKDPQGFASFAQQTAFKEYVEYVIAPSYDLHEHMGLLKTTITGLRLEENMSFRNFFSGRILWDESMASTAHSWIQANPGGLLVGLVGADHVKFQDGIPGRFARMGSGVFTCTSVILNPTLIDTRPPGSVSGVENAASAEYPDRITLQLRYLRDGVDPRNLEERRLPESTGGVLPLADYILVS